MECWNEASEIRVLAVAVDFVGEDLGRGRWQHRDDLPVIEKRALGVQLLVKAPYEHARLFRHLPQR